jgi:hypothetical protein
VVTALVVSLTKSTVRPAAVVALVWAVLRIVRRRRRKAASSPG